MDKSKRLKRNERILKLWETKRFSQVEIGKQYGITRQAVQKIIKGSGVVTA